MDFLTGNGLNIAWSLYSVNFWSMYFSRFWAHSQHKYLSSAVRFISGKSQNSWMHFLPLKLKCLVNYSNAKSGFTIVETDWSSHPSGRSACCPEYPISTGFLFRWISQHFRYYQVLSKRGCKYYLKQSFLYISLNVFCTCPYLDCNTYHLVAFGSA